MDKCFNRIIINLLFGILLLAGTGNELIGQSTSPDQVIQQEALLGEIKKLFPGPNEWVGGKDTFLEWLDETGELPPLFDEMKSYPFIPDPLQMKNGEVISMVDDWPKRRAEMMQQLEYYFLGKYPEPPENIRVQKKNTRTENRAIIHEIIIEFGPEHKAQLSFELILPIGEGPFPVFITQNNHRRWALIAVSRGYAGVVYSGSDSQDDTEDWISVYPDFDWTRLTRRAWAASRVVDYLETLDYIDKNKIALTGHSRNGKLSIIAGAIDNRFDAIISSSSGAGGANSFKSFSEAEFGESVEIITRRFPTWIHPRVRFFTGREDKLPVDAPNLIAAIAPRPFLYSVGLNDRVESVWDIENSKRSAKRAYELFDARDKIQLLYRPGMHETLAQDIEKYVDWLDFQFGRTSDKQAVSKSIFPTLDDWNKNIVERVDPLNFPEKGLDNLVTEEEVISGSILDNWVQRKSDIRQRIRAGLGITPPEAISQPGRYGAERRHNAQLLSRESTPEGVSKISLNFGNYINGDLYYPEKASENSGEIPVIIWTHPISTAHGYKPGYWREPSIHLSLVQQGYAVFTFDHIGHGARLLEIEQFYDRYPEWTLLGKKVHDIKQAVNALTLESATEYDEFGNIDFLDKNQIFLLGYAMGGRVALHAAALDERIAGVVSIAGFTPMRSDTQDKSTGGITRWSEWYPLQPWLADFIGYEDRIPYDYHEVLAAIAPRQVSVIAPVIDAQATQKDIEKAISKAKEVFGLHDAFENLRFKTPYDYNRLGPEMQQVLFDELRVLLVKPLLEVNPPKVPDEDKIIAIVGARMLDGYGGPPVDDAVVIIEGNRIAAAGSRNDVVIPEEAELYYAEGKTIMPGLIDSHFHSTMSNELINRFLKNGITTMRDPGHPFRFYQSLHFAEEPVPRMFLTGAHLDGFPPVWRQQAVVVKDKEHAKDTVIEHVENGGTGIKIYYRFPLEYYETVTETAANYGVPVMAHLELVDADDAIKAGVNGIEHVTSFGTTLADPEVAERFKEAVKGDDSARQDERFRLWSTIDLDSDRVKEVIELAVQNDVVFSPTLALFERKEDENEVKDFHVKGYRNMVGFVEMAHKAGMKIVTGSHMNVRYADLGWAYQREMEVLIDAGLSPMDVIVSSTIGNARYLRTDQRLGSIESGKLADFLIVDGDPLSDIKNMYNIHRVMLNGNWIEAKQ